MRPDVGEDSPGLLTPEEPFGRRALSRRCGPKAGDPDHASDRSGRDELARTYRATRPEMLGITDRIDSRGLTLDLAHLCKLRQRRHARLVDHEVLAVAHGRDAEIGALISNSSADDQCDAVIFQDMTRVIDAPRLRIVILSQPL